MKTLIQSILSKFPYVQFGPVKGERSKKKRLPHDYQSRAMERAENKRLQRQAKHKARLLAKVNKGKQ